MADGRLELRDLVVVDHQDRTPLKLACSHQPDVAAWLIIHGAASAGLTASSNSEVAAAAASTTTTFTTRSHSARSASIEDSTSTGAAATAETGANNSNDMNRYGHCDAKVLLHYAANSGARRTISEILEEWLHQHSVFTRLILPAIQLQRVRRQAGTPDCSVVSTPADNELL